MKPKIGIQGVIQSHNMSNVIYTKFRMFSWIAMPVTGLVKTIRSTGLSGAPSSPNMKPPIGDTGCKPVQLQMIYEISRFQQASYACYWLCTHNHAFSESTGLSRDPILTEYEAQI